MKAKLPIIAGIGVLALTLVYLLVIRGSDHPAKAPASAEQSEAEDDNDVTPKRAQSPSASDGPGLPAMIDDDPIGNLRLEGQAIDENGDPVGGALVILDSAPPKTTKSEEDGSFAFETLVSRRYSIHARSEERVGGPVVVTLSGSTDPVIVRMQPGGGLEVEVVDSNSAPISGATVTVSDLDTVQATTDSKGLATINNLPPGHTFISAEASGYAKSSSLVAVPSGPGNTGRQRLVLGKGAAVKGQVVDSEGRGVAGATVIARKVGEFFQPGGWKKDSIETDEEGRFDLPAVPLGMVQIVASHDEHPPSMSERFQVSPSGESDVKVVLKDGGTVAGRVVASDGSAVAWATVRVLTSLDRAGGMAGSHRQRIADEDGSFTIKGLPRDKLVIAASGERASSPSTDIDLAAKPKLDNLTLSLSVEGIIRGRVVDEKGQGVAEAQVQAVPSFWEGADMKEVRVRGPAFATSAGDGSFEIRGLPDTKYQVRAMRDFNSGAFSGVKGVPASPGGDAIEVTLATPGKIVGNVTLESGGAPDIAMVSIGWGANVPTDKGGFTINEVPPGNYSLSVRGPQFAPKFVEEIAVKPGETLNLGTVQVKEGRSISGRVIDASGSPVAGADVAFGTQVISEGASFIPEQIVNAMKEQSGLRYGKSDENGRYRMGGLPDSEGNLVADHPQVGRSLGTKVVKAGQNAEHDLVLGPVGSVRGKVTLNGEVVPNVQVIMTPTEGAPHIVVVTTDESGGFFAERVAAGSIKVSAMIQAAGRSSMAAKVVEVAPNKEAEAILDIEEGAINYSVRIAGVDGAKIDAAQVFLFKGVATVKTGAELNALFLSGANSAKMQFAFGDKPATFEKVSPGTFSVCVIPINGDMNDPAFAQKLQRHVAELAVYCERVNLSESPQTQAHEAIVPPMTPLPEDG